MDWGNVDNTTDAGKPVSTLQAAADTAIGSAAATDATTKANAAQAAAIAASQPIDADLTAVAALSPSNDDLMQRKSGAWTNRTPAQVDGRCRSPRPTSAWVASTTPATLEAVRRHSRPRSTSKPTWRPPR